MLHGQHTKGLTVAVERKHDNGYTEWELDVEYTSMLMNLNPNVTDKLMLDYRMNPTMLNSSKVNSYKFLNLQWLLKQVCDNPEPKLLQTYALDNPNLLGTIEANIKWLDAISASLVLLDN